MADDALAVRIDADTVTALPAPRVLNLRRTERAILDASGLDGRIIGRGFKLVAEWRDGSPPLPLRAAYFPRRGPEADGVVIEPWGVPDPRQLLVNTFVGFVRTPGRACAQLDACAAISGHVALFDLRVPASVDADALTPSLSEHIRSLAARQ